MRVGFRVGDLFDMRKKNGIGRLVLQSSIVKGVVSGAASRGSFEDMGPVQLEDFMNMGASPSGVLYLICFFRDVVGSIKLCI